MIAYFTGAAETIEFHRFDRPLEYFGDGDRVVIVGDETFKIRQTGVTHRAERAWVYDVPDGQITRIFAIEDLSGIGAEIREVVAKAQSA